ncbi:hypothetical protein DFH94DRAFT_742599 [Russula ochroleuca]|jgi:hypothetical protein|uniref:Reverse transcriptase zinc-binding domain-containing protein n=1 Tax=Russula ochroleuca TaxID=152965 RepID=A0A9P5MWK8_9AGAM|nr:hypothetical protein DFH94DRAFT_742599 [Russula ochroleuca]
MCVWPSALNIARDRVFTAPVGQAREQGNKDKFSRLTRSTFYRVVTGHAFIGEYTRRFYPRHTREQIACPCGEPIETVEHVLLHCPRYTAESI